MNFNEKPVTLYLAIMIALSITLSDCCCNSKCKGCQVVISAEACDCITDTTDPSFKACEAQPNSTYNPTLCSCLCNSGWTGLKCDQPLNNTCDSTVTDIDGNVYDVVKIGSKCWMKQNLKTTRYNDGTIIPTGLSNADWASATTGACAIYDDNSANESFGRLYNYNAVITGKLCPTGWRMPAGFDFEDLKSAVNSNAAALKATTTWPVADGATNTSKFTALAVGFRVLNGTYYGMGTDAHFWANSQGIDGNAIHMFLTDNNANSIAIESYPKNNGFSCRCVKD